MSRLALFSLCLALPISSFAQLVAAPAAEKPVNVEERYRQIKGEKLGVYLATKFPGKRALLLLPPEMPLAPGEDAGQHPYVAVLKGLEKGLKGITIVGKIEPKLPADAKAKLQHNAAAAGGMGMMMMPEAHMWFGVNELNKELAGRKGTYDVLICLTGLPGMEMMGGMKHSVPFTKLSMWTDPDVSVALAEGGVAKLGRLIQAGKVCAAVTYKQRIPDAAYEMPPPADLDKAFDIRFVLITPDNLKQHLSYFPTQGRR